MLLQMRKTLAGPEYAVQDGELWECSDEKLAKQLIDEGAAVEPLHDGPLEMISTFHGGLKPVLRELHEAKPEIPFPPDGSTAKEEHEVEFPLDRRTADELATDAKIGLQEGTWTPGTDEELPPLRSSNQQAIEEIKAKVAISKALPGDPRGSAHQKLVKDPKASGKAEEKHETKGEGKFESKFESKPIPPPHDKKS